MTREKFLIFVFLVFACFQLPLVAGEKSGLYRAALLHFEKKEFAAGIEKYYKLLITQNILLSKEARKRDLRPVKEYFFSIGKADPTNLKACFYLSLVFRIVDMMKPADKLIEGVLKRFPDSPMLLLAKGEYLFWQKNVAEGIQFFSKLQKHPQGTKYWEIAKIVNSRYGVDADPLARRALRVRQAYSQWDLLEREKATEIFLSVLKDFPNDLECSQSLININLEVSNTANARMILMELKKGNPNDQKLLIMETRISFQEKNFTATARVGDAVLKNDPENSFVKAMVAEAKFQNGDYKNAGELFQELVKIDFNNIGFVTRRKDCYVNDGKSREAIEFLKKIVEKIPSEFFLKMELAGLYEQQPDDSHAIAVYDELRKMPNPFRDEAQSRFVLLEKAKTLKEAEEVLKRISEGDSGEEKVSSPPPATFTRSVYENSISGSNDRFSQAQNPSNSSSLSSIVPSGAATPKPVEKKPVSDSKELFNRLSTLYE